MALLLVAALGACGSGQQTSGQVIGSGVSVSEQRSIGTFDSVSIEAKSADVYITVGSPTAVKVTADDNVLPHVTTALSGSRLVIGLDSRISTHIGIRLDITTPSLVGVTAGAAVKVHLAGVAADGLVLTGELGAQFIANGTANKLSLTLLTASRADLQALQTKDAMVSLDGSSTAEVFATNSVGGEAHRASHLGVWGQSPSVTVLTSEASTVSMMGMPSA